MSFERLKGRKSRLREMFDDTVIIELLDGRIYGGALDDYYYNGGGVISLYYPKLLDKKHHRWVDNDIYVKIENKLVRDSLPDFWITDIKNVYVLPKKLRGKLSLDDALQLYIDPYFRPLPTVKCKWNGNRTKNTAKLVMLACMKLS
jgi:hypothetical protein